MTLQHCVIVIVVGTAVGSGMGMVAGTILRYVVLGMQLLVCP